MTTFGDRVKAFRERYGMSQADLAEAAGFHWIWIELIESNTEEPRWEHVLKLAEALRVSIDELAGRQTDIVQLEDDLRRSRDAHLQLLTKVMGIHGLIGKEGDSVTMSRLDYVRARLKELQP